MALLPSQRGGGLFALYVRTPVWVRTYHCLLVCEFLFQLRRRRVNYTAFARSHGAALFLFESAERFRLDFMQRFWESPQAVLSGGRFHARAILMPWCAGGLRALLAAWYEFAPANNGGPLSRLRCSNNVFTICTAAEASTHVRTADVL